MILLHQRFTERDGRGNIRLSPLVHGPGIPIGVPPQGTNHALRGFGPTDPALRGFGPRVVWISETSSHEDVLGDIRPQMGMIFRTPRLSASIASTSPLSSHGNSVAHQPRSDILQNWFSYAWLVSSERYLCGRVCFACTRLLRRPKRFFKEPARVRRTYCPLSPRASSMLHVMLLFLLPILMPLLGRYLEDRLCVACTRLLLRSKMFSGITAFIGQRPRICSSFRFSMPSPWKIS